MKRLIEAAKTDEYFKEVLETKKVTEPELYKKATAKFNRGYGRAKV